jgi:hypothetical protein
VKIAEMENLITIEAGGQTRKDEFALV